MNSAEFKNLDALMKAVADVVREHIAKEVEPLKVKLAELEARTNFKYCGTWYEKGVYHEGNFVTDNGCVWYCHRRTSRRPSLELSGDWQLAVRRGADGRDAATLNGKGHA
jgi:hypothetical protein